MDWVLRCVILANVKSDQESVKGNVEFAINRLLNGQMVLGWLVEKIRASGISKEDLRDVLAMFHQNYAENIIFIDLEKTCKQNDFI